MSDLPKEAKVFIYREGNKSGMGCSIKSKNVGNSDKRMPALPGKLILVSNREPYAHETVKGEIRSKQTIGGLVSALDPILQSCKGVWVAWGSGSADRKVCDERCRVKIPPENPQYTLKRVWLSETERKRYYRGFCNEILWPLFHNFLEKVMFEPKYWKAYKRVNKRFAKAVLEESSGKPVIWVHDYHLALVPAMVCDKNNAMCAYFCHIPWPSWEVFRTLPWRREILEGVLGSGLIGFHTERYVKNFKDCVENEFGTKFEGDSIEMEGKRSTVKAFPIGIDYNEFDSTASLRKTQIATKILRKKLGAKILILGFDRLDYTKGILNRLGAFERFLEKYPRYRGKVVFVQLATPSRTKINEYRMMKREIDGVVGHINGRFQKPEWVPVRYFYRSSTREQLIAYYRAADIALVTPLVDGMNLVAKEYVASKGRTDGVLILSEFAGAAERMKGAILVNPFDIEAVADAIKGAIKMPVKEKRERLQLLREKVKAEDVNWWFENYFAEMSNQFKAG